MPAKQALSSLLQCFTRLLQIVWDLESGICDQENLWLFSTTCNVLLSADSFSSALQVVPEEEKEKEDYFQKKKEDSF